MLSSTLQITDYLHPPPSSGNPIATYTGHAPNYATTTIRTLIDLLQPYQLTKSELLMILNLRPLDLTLLDCVIEECDERFSPERQEEILRIIGDVLGREYRAEKLNGTSGLLNEDGVIRSDESDK